MNNSSLVARAVLSVFVLSIPLAASAQYAPPPGYENMMPTGNYGTPPSGFEGMMPTGDNGSQFGQQPNFEEMMKKGEEMEKMGEQRAQMGLNQMKKRIKSMLVPIKHMEKTIEKVKNAGYGVSQEVLDALAKGKAAVATLENATSMDDAETAFEDFNEFVDILDETIEPLNMLANFPKILKQADRTFKKLVSSFNKQKTKAEKGDIDLSSVISGIQSKIDALTVVFNTAQAEAKAGNSEEAFRLLEDEYFGNMEDAFQSVGMLQAATNLTKAVKMVEKGIVKAEKISKKFGSKGSDMTAANQIIKDSKDKLAVLKAMLQASDFEPEDAVDLLEELDGLRDDFEAAVEEETGKNLGGKDAPDFFNMPMPAMPKEFSGGSQGAGGFEKFDMSELGF